jgi:hypothetical protein
MTDAAATKKVFDELVSKVESLLTTDDLAVLNAHDKDEAIRMLHLTAGHQLRNALGLWADEASDRLMAIEKHANQGMLLGFDADGASSALLGHMWDKLHAQ